MGLIETLKANKFDTRLIDWNLKHGVITDKELQAHMQSLPDSTNSAVRIEIDESDLIFDDEPQDA